MKVTLWKGKIRKEQIEIFGITLLAVVNALSVRNTVVSLIVSFVEVLLCAYFLLCRSMADFICLFLVLLSTSIESMTFALGNSSIVAYSFINLPIFKAYHLLMIVGVAVCKTLMSIRISVENKKGLLYKVTGMFCFFLVIGIGMTLLTLLFNDNQVFIHQKMWSYIARDFYHTFFSASLMVILSSLIKNNEKFAERLGALIKKIFVSLIIGAAVCVLCGNYYERVADATYLTYTQALFMTTPFLLFFFTDEMKMGRLPILILGCLTLLIQQGYTLGAAGAWVLLTFLVIALFIVKLTVESLRIRDSYKKKKRYVLLGGLLVVFVTYIISSGTILGILQGKYLKNSQVLYKLSTVTDMLKKSGSGIQSWYSRLSSGSIQVRIEQFVNIWLEFVQKPWYFLFGKGYGGSVLHRWGIANWNVSGSTYPDAMLEYGTYSLMHTGLAEMFINFGLVGLLSSLWLGFLSMKAFFSKNSNVWIFLGVVWLYFYYTVYYSMVIGVACLCYGIYLYDRDKREGRGKIG